MALTQCLKGIGARKPPTTCGAKPKKMNNEFDSNDANAENEELLLELESAAQKLESSSQQVAELQRRLNETAMARVVGHRRIDLRALQSLDLRPGNYEISTSEPDDLEPRVTLVWMAGTLILGVDLIPTDRDVSLALPSIREPRIWQIPPPPPNALPPPLPQVEPNTLTEAQWAERGSQDRARREAWMTHHQRQTQAAEKWALSDRPQARQDEEMVAEAMMAEIEARRADPKANAGRTIMDVGQAVADQLLSANRNGPA